MPSLLFVAFLAIASLQGTFGAPSCNYGSKNLGSCVSKCKAKMGNHHWGSFSYDPKPSSVVPMSSSGNTDKPVTPAAKLAGNPTPSELPTSAPTAQPKASSTPSAASSSQPAASASNSSVSSADIEAYLSAHNSVRAQHGAAALTWSDALSSTAQSWADGCLFQHSHGENGENLAAGTGDYTIANAVGDWTAEYKDYHPNDPTPSHFTQVVWKATTQVGCAVKDCAAGTIFPEITHYYVCEYSPPGNVIGEFAQNVQV